MTMLANFWGVEVSKAAVCGQGVSLRVRADFKSILLLPGPLEITNILGKIRRVRVYSSESTLSGSVCNKCNTTGAEVLLFEDQQSGT